MGLLSSSSADRKSTLPSYKATATALYQLALLSGLCVCVHVHV